MSFLAFLYKYKCKGLYEVQSSVVRSTVQHDKAMIGRERILAATSFLQRSSSVFTTYGELFCSQSSQIEKATKEKLDMEKQYRNHDAELNGLYEQRKEGDAKEIQDLASANKALNERLRAVNIELEDLKNRSTNIESSYKLEVEGLQSKLEQIEIDAKKENEQRDMIVQHFSTERSELNSSISKRDELIKEMTATKEKLSMDVKRYLEELKMYENKCMEEETKSANLSKELKSSAETTRVLKLEKIVFEENIADGILLFVNL